MDIELQVVTDCPNTPGAYALLRQALDDVGLHAATIRTTVVSDDADAQRLGFIGSPTFRVDGRDLFTRDAPPAWACRLYSTPGGNSGLPDPDSLRSALRHATDPRP